MRREDWALFTVGSWASPRAYSTSSHSILVELGSWGRPSLWGSVPRVLPQPTGHWAAETMLMGRVGGVVLSLCLASSTFAEGPTCLCPQSKQPADPAGGKAQPMRHPRPEGQGRSEHRRAALPMRRALRAPSKCRNKTNTINKLEQFRKDGLGSVWLEGII